MTDNLQGWGCPNFEQDKRMSVTHCDNLFAECCYLLGGPDFLGPCVYRIDQCLGEDDGEIEPLKI